MIIAFRYLAPGKHGDVEIAGTGVGVHNIFFQHELGETLEQLVEAFRIPLAAVYEALAYAAEHPDEMETIRQANAEIEERGMREIRPLRAAGHLLCLPPELGVAGQDDEAHLLTASIHQAVLVTTNPRDFDPLHSRWQAVRRQHAGILTTPELEAGELTRRLERAARLLSPEAARNQLMRLSIFRDEEEARNYVIALTPGY